jgi:hypothetical protein
MTQFLESMGVPRGTDIRLVSCSTGSLPDGFAQQLARQWGGIVYAPTGSVVGDLSVANNGYWRVFRP